MESASPVTVAGYLTRGDAEVACAALAASGIPAAIRADDEGGLNPGFFADYRVRLEVPPDRLEDARTVLGVPEQVHVTRDALRVIVGHARRCAPEEACGLLEGDAAGTVLAAHPTENVAHATDRFTVDPVAHHALWRRAEEAGRVLVGSFHSHPASAAVPSPVDVAGALDPEWLYVIVGPLAASLEVRGYRIRAGQVAEVTLVIGRVPGWT
jgi:proteasome lid subunit RPN8/RPN11